MGWWVCREGLGIKVPWRWEVLGCFKSPTQPVSEALAPLWGVSGQHLSLDTGFQGHAEQHEASWGDLVGSGRTRSCSWAGGQRFAKSSGVTEGTFRVWVGAAMRRSGVPSSSHLDTSVCLKLSDIQHLLTQPGVPPCFTACKPQLSLTVRYDT